MTKGDQTTNGSIPPFILGKDKILLRGTIEWNEREKARERVGCKCLSFGGLRDE